MIILILKLNNPILKLIITILKHLKILNNLNLNEIEIVINLEIFPFRLDLDC